MSRVDDYLAHLEDGIKGRRIALAVGDFIEASDEQVLKALQDAAEVFKDLGASWKK